VGAWVLYLGTSPPRCEDNHQLPSSAQVKNAWSYTSLLHPSAWRGT
jgi:hypothetical protein